MRIPAPRSAFAPAWGLAALLAGVFAVLPACKPSADKTAAPPPADGARAVRRSIAYVPQPIGDPMTGRPWITHLAVADLDQDGLPDIAVCDAQTNQVRWIRQFPKGVFTEYLIGETMAPGHVEVCDVNQDGKPDLLIAGMGQIFPNNDRIGSVVIFENLGGGQFRRHLVAEHLARVADVRGANLLGDGKIQLIVGCFGYDQGETLWMENQGDWKFVPHVVNSQSGPIHCPAADFNGDGRISFACLISQEWEEVHLFDNLGGGKFRDRIIWGSTNEDFGSSGLLLADVNRDGRPDFVYTNGDAFDYARPGPRPWHGIQWFENQGAGKWKYHRVGDFPGAYSPACADLDGDGHPDLAAVSTFNDWSSPNAVSLMVWLNDGHQNFTAVPIARQPTHLLALAVGDLDGDGVPELLTGGFHAYPPWDHMSRILLWKRQ
jgi:hypothetical protein